MIHRSSRRCTIALAGLACLLVVTTGPTNAEWRPLGPDGGFTHAVRHAPGDPSIVWASTVSGVFRSGDGGTSWEPRSFASSYGYQSDLEVAYEAANRVWAVSTEGVYRTTDGGSTWAHLRGLPGETLYDLVLDPTTAGRLYALDTWHTGRLFASSDFGDHWRRVGTGVLAAVVEPDGSLLTLHDPHLSRSHDGGKTSHRVASSPFTNDSIATLVSDPRGRHRWAIGDDRLWHSPSRGRTWSLVDPAINLRRLVPSPAEPTFLYGLARRGVVRSSDHGQTWSRPGSAAFYPSDLSAHPSRRDEILVSTSGYDSAAGIVRSRDGGATFERSTRNLDARSVHTVTVDPWDSHLVLAIDPYTHRLHVSRDGGTSWSELLAFPSPLAVTAQVSDVAFDPHRPGRLFLLSVSAGLARSDDGGETYVAAPALAQLCRCQRLEVDPRHPNRLYSFGFGGVLYRSDDAGEHWRPYLSDPVGNPLGGVRAIALAPSSPDRAMILADHAGERRIYETRDDGETTVHLTSAGVTPWSIAYDPAGPDVRLAVVTQPAGIALLRRVGDGPWDVVDTEQHWRHVHAVGNSLFADVRETSGPPQSALLTSEDGGQSWSPFGPPLPPGVWLVGEARPVRTAVDDERLFVPTIRGVHMLVATATAGSPFAAD